MKRLILLCGAILAVTSTEAADRPAPPKSPAPVFVTVARTDKDKGTINLSTSEMVPVTKYIDREVIRDGKKVAVVEAVTEFQQVSREITYRTKGLRLLEAGGKEISGDEMWKRLKPGTIVLRQSGGGPIEPIDPAYLKLLAKDALILAPPIKVEPK